MNTYIEWVEALQRSADQYGVVFAQVGYANEPLRDALLLADMRTLSVTAYLESELEGPGRFVIIENFESLRNIRDTSPFGKVREKVLGDLDRGYAFILLSRAPRTSYPDAVGSSLLEDATLAHAPFLGPGNFTDSPVCRELGIAPSEALEKVLFELGFDACASLDRVLYENMLIGTEALMLFSARELEAFDAAGLTSVDQAGRTWNFGKHLVELKAALDEVLASAVEPQGHMSAVSAGLWRIEKMIRREIRRRAVGAWGKAWRTQCLSTDQQSKVYERASESAYLGASSLKQIRDPLEWLTLGELLSLKEKKEIGQLGLAAAHWRMFSTQIAPLRNQLAHMRSLKSEDVGAVVKWEKVLALKFDHA